VHCGLPLEHTIRFAKQTLGATTPKVRTPEQADRWIWLILAALTQLRLARNLVADHRLPWQPPLAADKMTPGRVRAGFAYLLPHLGGCRTASELRLSRTASGVVAEEFVEVVHGAE
jgi:hypothetical protein